MSPARVLIAGGGVAGLEATLALQALAGDLVDVELLAPTETFVYRPMLVAEPFGVGGKTNMDLRRIVDDAGARHRRDALASVSPADGAVTTSGGERIEYDALLVALGARSVEAIPGALTFSGDAERRRFSDLLDALGRRGSRRLAFVIPRLATWTIAAYELALLTAAERDLREIRGLEITLVTPEHSPLELFGEPATQLVSSNLEQAGVALRLGCVAGRFEARTLSLAGGEQLEFDQVVALPGLEVAEISGLPQRQHGFVVTDARMHVAGLENVWAAGDATSFPIKQGGLAAQQAEIAARSIAARAGAHVPIHAFQPVLRAALLTGHAPEFLRSSLGKTRDEAASVGHSLWWPPAKLAGDRLGPYLARALGAGTQTRELVDFESGEDPAADETEHAQAVAVALAAADADADLDDFAGALKWLGLVEQLDLVIPSEYVARRDEWRRRLDPKTEPDRAARRTDPRFATAADAISDLQRRLGWLREFGGRTESEMSTHLAELDRGVEQLKALTRRATPPFGAPHERR